jgi:hypothetical protein
MSALNSLPDEVLKLVIQHVPLKDRIASCCLVNKRLQAVAVAASDQLTLNCDGVGPIPTYSFLKYLTHYGKHVTSLRMEYFSGAPILQLSCPNLLELVLWQCSAHFGPTELGQPGLMRNLSKLKRLTFFGGFIKDIEACYPTAELDSLSSLVHLEHLELLPLSPVHGCTLSVATLPRLEHLMYLNVHKLSAENLAQLGALTKLKELELSADIPYGPVGPSTVPGLAFPPSLTKLVLVMGNEVEAGILSLVPTGLQHLAVECDVVGPAEGPGSFLSGMARMSCLTHLDLTPPKPVDLPPAGPAMQLLRPAASWLSSNCSPVCCRRTSGRSCSLLHTSCHTSLLWICVMMTRRLFVTLYCPQLGVPQTCAVLSDVAPTCASFRKRACSTGSMCLSCESSQV